MAEIVENAVFQRHHQHKLKFKSIDELHNAIRVYGGGKMNYFSERIVLGIGDLPSQYIYTCDIAESGPFYKCIICAARERNGEFSLNLSPHHFDYNTEKDLAQKLGASIGYVSCEIERTYKVSGKRFAIPINDIECAYTFFGQKFDKERFCNKLTTPHKSSIKKNRVISYFSSITLINDDNLCASIGLTDWRCVQAHEYKKNQAHNYEYRIVNDCLTGPAKFDNMTNCPIPIGIQLLISSIKRPTYDSNLEKLIRHMGDAIEAKWRESLNVQSNNEVLHFPSLPLSSPPAQALIFH